MFQSSVDVGISCYANWLLVTWYGLGGFASRAGSAVAGGVLPDEGRGTGGGGLPTVGNALGSDNDGDRDGGRALDGDGQRSEGPDVTEPASPDSVETTRGSESCVSRWRFASSVCGLFGFNDTWGETALDLLDTSQTLMFFYDLPSAVYKAASHGGPQGTTGWASTTNKITRVLRKSGRLGPRQARQMSCYRGPAGGCKPLGSFLRQLQCEYCRAVRVGRPEVTSIMGRYSPLLREVSGRRPQSAEEFALQLPDVRLDRIRSCWRYLEGLGVPVRLLRVDDRIDLLRRRRTWSPWVWWRNRFYEDMMREDLQQGLKGQPTAKEKVHSVDAMSTWGDYFRAWEREYDEEV